MSDFNDFLNEIKISTFTDELTGIPNDENFVKNRDKCINEYVDFIYGIISNSPFEKTIAIIDFFANRFPHIHYYLLEKKDDKIMRATLVLEKLNHIEASSIKDNLNEAKSKFDFIMFAKNGVQIDKRRNIYLKKYDLLNDYLKDKEKVDETTYDDLRNFANNLDKIDMLIFQDSKNSILSRENIINTIFSSNIDIEILSKIFHNVLLKNPYLKSFNYEEILINDETYVEKISGLYRKMPKVFFDYFQSDDIKEDELESLNIFIFNIGKINEEDEQGLLWFFGQLSSKMPERFDNYFKENNEYYKKYSNNINASFDNSVDKLLKGEKDIDSSIIESLGSSQKFKDNFYVLLDKFINSNDKEYQKALLAPLTRSLAELQKEKYGLSFNIVNTTNRLNNNTFGYFNQDDNILYINPFMFDAFEDKKKAFVYACEAIFHETRHALQHKDIEEDSSYDFDNLMLAMDYYLSRNNFNGYYKRNYDNLSYEKDARNASAIKTMEFFKDYPNMHQYLNDLKIEEPSISDIIRKDLINYNECILKLFINEVNQSIKYCENKEQLDYALKQFKDYKVLWQFFDIDLDNYCIKPKIMEYFNERKDDINTKKFLYLMNVNKYMEDNGYLLDEMKDEEMEKATEENVGSIPKR